MGFSVILKALNAFTDAELSIINIANDNTHEEIVRVGIAKFRNTCLQTQNKLALWLWQCAIEILGMKL